MSYFHDVADAFFACEKRVVHARNITCERIEPPKHIQKRVSMRRGQYLCATITNENNGFTLCVYRERGGYIKSFPYSK